MRVQDTEVHVVGKTAAGKELGWRNAAGTSFREAAFKDGGQLPAKLIGHYSNTPMLVKLIQAYLREDHNKAEKKAAKATTKAKADKAVKGTK